MDYPSIHLSIYLSIVTLRCALHLDLCLRGLSLLLIYRHCPLNNESHKDTEWSICPLVFFTSRNLIISTGRKHVTLKMPVFFPLFFSETSREKSQEQNTDCGLLAGDMRLYCGTIFDKVL